MQLRWRQLACRCRRHMVAPIYLVYEHRLLRHVRAFPVPRHIGLILDGNRRFGRQNNLSHPDDIYMGGVNKLDDLLDWCIELEFPAITQWVFSTENRKRPPAEVSGILAAVEKKLRFLACDGHFHSRRIRVLAVGRLELLPPSTLAAVRAAEAATKDYTGMHLTIAAAYGGREEIVDAVQGLLREQVEQNKTLKEAIELVTPEPIGRSLYAPHLPDPDLIIRTSGEI
jgi:short-chain Z-isoprenyl diphosphate synthase